MSNQLEQIRELIQLREKARLGGGQKRIDAQHEKVNVRLVSALPCFLTKAALAERFDMFVTAVPISGCRRKPSWEMGLLLVTAPLKDVWFMFFAQDFTVFGGSLSETMSMKICKIMQQAMKVGAPFDRNQRFRRSPYPGERGYWPVMAISFKTTS